MEDADDLYRVLGTSPDATADELKRAYRSAMRSAHPDLGGSAEGFRLVQHAWRVLGDPGRRADYDRRSHVPRTQPRVRDEPVFRPTGWTSTPTRRAGRPEEARAPKRIIVHGHPGGSSRSIYLDLFRRWMTDPTKPVAPASPVYRRPDHPFARTSITVAIRIECTLLAVIVGLLVLAAIRSLNANGDLSSLLVPLVASIAVSTGAAVLGRIAVAGIRVLGDGSRRSVRAANARERLRYEEALDRHRYEREEFALTRRRRSLDVDSYLAEPFALSSVELAPYRARLALAQAIAQERTSRALLDLSAEFAVWHDVLLGPDRVYAEHILVGPQGLLVLDSVPDPASDQLAPGNDRLAATSASRERLARAYAIARAIGIEGVTAVIRVHTSAEGVDTDVEELTDPGVRTFSMSADRLALSLLAGLPRVERAPLWQVDRLVERVRSVASFA